MTPPQDKPLSPLVQIRRSFETALHLDRHDSSIVDFLVSLVLANLRGGDAEPVWGFICGPPGSCKTECLRPLRGWKYAIFIDELTANSLASGYEDEDHENPSLLNELDGRILVIKDFTTMIQSPPVLRNKIMGTLRAAFDDNFSKADGKTGRKTYACKFGTVAAVTGVLDDFLTEDQQLGQRFVIFRFSPTAGRAKDRKDDLLRILRSTTTKEAWRSSLKTVMQANLDELRSKVVKHIQQHPGEQLVHISDEQLEQVAVLADITVRLRTRPYHSGKPAEAEVGSRLVQQLLNLMQCRAFADDRDHLTEFDYLFARRIARDSIPLSTRRILRTMLGAAERDNTAITGDQIASWSSIDTTAVYDLLMQLIHIGAVEKAISEQRRRPGEDGRRQTRYQLAPDTVEQLTTTGLLKGINL